MSGHDVQRARVRNLTACPCGAVSASDGASECEACESFLCDACGCWTPWDEGAHDATSDRCDDCTFWEADPSAMEVPC